MLVTTLPKAMGASLSALLITTVLLTGCTSLSNRMSMSDSQVSVSLEKGDYEIIGDVKGVGSVTTILIFRLGGKAKSGSIVGMPVTAGATIIPIIGPLLGLGGLSIAEQNAVYNAIASVQGADALIFPKFERETFSIPLLYRKETVTVRAKAIRLKK